MGRTIVEDLQGKVLYFLDLDYCDHQEEYGVFENNMVGFNKNNGAYYGVK